MSFTLEATPMGGAFCAQTDLWDMIKNFRAWDLVLPPIIRSTSALQLHSAKMCDSGHLRPSCIVAADGSPK
jgi:hypothetical protein